jgi:hypothetical protein
MSITMIGLDTAKSVFQVHAVNEAGEVVVRRKLQRRAWFKGAVYGLHRKWPAPRQPKDSTFRV